MKQHQVSYSGIHKMNNLAIDLNNHAVTELKNGNIDSAFELLSTSSSIIRSSLVNHPVCQCGPSPYQYQWEDCSSACSSRRGTFLLGDGNSSHGHPPLLFLGALRVIIPDENVGIPCKNGYAWVVGYNLAICCSILGFLLAEKGTALLVRALDLYRNVSSRIGSKPSSIDFKLLQMGVMNNQACIFHEFSLHRATAVCLKKLSLILQHASDVEEHTLLNGPFMVNLELLGRPCPAAAA